MTMPRIVGTYYRFPKHSPPYILVNLEGGRILRFKKGLMLAEMKRLKMMRLKLAIIHDMAYHRAMLGDRQVPTPIQELLCEFHISAQEMGAVIGVRPARRKSKKR